MAGILQLRRGLKSTYISEGTNLAEAFFVTENTDGSAISPNTLIVGVSGSVGDDVMTLAKLSLANKDNTYADYNSGSFWITGDYTGSNMILSDNAIISGSVFIEKDLHLEGHLYLGSGSDGDIVKIQSEFSGSLVPDNDLTGSTTPDPTVAHFDLGSREKRWRNIYLQRDGSSNGFLSGSHIDLTGNIKVDGEGRFGTLRVDDLTDNRILLAGVGGEVEDDANLTYDGQDFRLTNSDYYQSGSGASFQFSGGGADFTGSISNYQLRVDNGIVFTNELGTLDNQSQFTWDGGLLKVDGNISGSGTLEIDGQSTLASLNVEDLTNDRILIAGTGGEVEDDQYFRYTGNNFIIGSDEHFKVTTATGNTFISGAVQMFSTLNVDDQSTLASVNVEDLTDNRVVIVGAGGEIEDDGNFTFNGTELNIGTGNFTVQQGSGDVHTVGNVDIDLDLNIDGGDLTTNQSTFNLLNSNATTVNAFGASTSVNIGTGGQGGGLTTIGHDLTVVGDLTIQGETTQLNTTTLNVEDKNILIASGALDSNAANGAGITIDGANQTLTYNSTSGRMVFNDSLEVSYAAYIDTIYRRASDNTYINLDSNALNFGIGGENELQIDGTQTRIYGNLQLDGDLISKGNISGSSFNGTTLLSSSNENFADYSQSVDSRLDYLEGPFSTSVDSRLDEIEGPMSTSLDLRLIEIFATGSDHETRIDEIETTFSSSVDSRLIESFNSSSDHESRLVAQELFSSSIESHLPQGTVSGSTQIADLGFLVTSSALYNDANNLAVGTSTPTNLGATQFTINDSNTAGTSGLISFTDSDVVKSYDYVLNNYRYIDTNTGVGIVLKPDADGDKSWIIDTEGDLVSNGGAWSSGSLYANNLIASSSVTASNMLVDNDIVTNNLFASSSVNITQTLNLASQDPLPAGTIGDLAVSGSNLFFYNGAWTQVV